MTDNVIIVDYDPFVMESRVTICTNGQRKYTKVCSSIDELTTNLIQTAYKENIFQILMNSPFAISSQVSETIKNQEKEQYSYNKIKVGNL